MMSHPYTEPEVKTILTQASFLLSLNFLDSILDHYIYCGLLGQIALGITWGTPGAKWLETTETTIIQLGYLGLILMVYEGGLSTSLSSLRANLVLSVVVALTGVLNPIGLSYVLSPLLHATKLQCFAAGAALCSTSLGTTFSILQASRLSSTRLGVVLTSAAMLDDVAGLVMVQVISNIGKSSGSFQAKTILRPILVSIGFAVAAPAVCYLVARPTLTRLTKMNEKSKVNGLSKFSITAITTTIDQAKLSIIVHLLLLFSLVAAAGYAGTSVLLAAYISGASITWWDSVKRSDLRSPPARAIEDNVSGAGAVPDDGEGDSGSQYSEPLSYTGLQLYEIYLASPVKRILKPLFFVSGSNMEPLSMKHHNASVGFSIPITLLFRGDVIWKGFVYAVLMVLGKAVCGVWLIRMPITRPILTRPKTLMQSATEAIHHLIFDRLLRRPFKMLQQNNNTSCSRTTRETSSQEASNQDVNLTTLTASGTRKPSGDVIPSQNNTCGCNTSHHQADNADGTDNNAITTTTSCNDENAGQAVSHTTPAPVPRSLYPAAILGSGMVARGEIGFLISSLAEAEGMFTPQNGKSAQQESSSSDIFLVVTWAIVLCTFIGPLFVGFIVRRVRNLQAALTNGNGRDVLGVWGVN